MVFPKLKIALAALLIAVPAAASAQHGGHGGPGGIGGVDAFFKFLGMIRGQTREIDREATQVYEATPRAGSCGERREHILKILPDALRLGRYARDVYDADHDGEMKKASLRTLDLGGGRSAFYDAAGKRYAEVRLDAERDQVAVIFRGTRLAVGSDVSTDVLNFIGFDTAYYEWASSLVAQAVREHPGKQVVVTGQSLGGGLAVYAILHNPGVTGFVFNPAGLSLLRWATTAAADRARANAAITVVSTRNARHIEPVTAMSLAGRSVLPGHIVMVETGALDALTLHSAKTVVSALEAAAAANAEGQACDGDLGVLAR